MPWTTTKLPPAAKNLSAKQKERFVKVANAILHDTGDEGLAIRTALARAQGLREIKKRH